jgi:hypothetical protein
VEPAADTLAHGDQLPRAVGLDMAAAGWKPTVDIYLGRVPKVRERNRPVTFDQTLDWLSDKRAVLLVNTKLGRAAAQVPATSILFDDGEVERRSD